jgi:hypothetical protein
MRILPCVFVVLLLGGMGETVVAQETAYFVTYNDHLEEPGNLEVGTSATTGSPGRGQGAFLAPYLEFEYGVNQWWTSEFYLEGQSTAGDGAAFTGWRLESRFRPLESEHRINPVLYLEYENINEASHIFKEIVGRSGDNEPVAELSKIRAHELEGKLILSSDSHHWNFAEDFIVEKNLSAREGFEFGYALAVSRPLATLAGGGNCHWCRKNFVAGLELYGGLGSTLGFGLQDTTHYLAPVVSYELSDYASLRLSPALRLTSVGSPLLFRVAYVYEVRGFLRRVGHLLGANP